MSHSFLPSNGIVRFCLIASLFAGFHSAVVAGSQLDSLRHELNEVSDINKVDVLIQIGDSLQYFDPDGARKHFETAVELAKLTGEKKAIGKSLQRLGSFESHLGKFKEGLEAEIESLQIYTSEKDSDGMATAYMGIAIAYSDLSMHQLAMENYIHSKAIYEDLKDTLGLAYIYLNLGTCYHYLEDYESAKSLYRQAEAAFKQLGYHEELADVLQNIGNVYGEDDDEESAYSYYQKALGIYEEHEFIGGWMLCLANTSLTLANLDSLESALAMVNSSLELCTQSGDLYTLTYALNSKGYILTRLKKYNEAEKELNRAYHLALENDFSDELQQNYLYKSDLFHATGNQLQAYIHRVMHDELSDSLEQQNKLGTINSQMLAYETEKRDRQIKMLEAEREKELLKMEKSNSRYWFFGSILVLLLAGMTAFYVLYNKKHKSELLLQEKQRELTRINLNLEDEKSMAEKAMNSKSEFLSMMTHELRTPLNAVIGIANVLESKKRNEDEEALKTLKFASNNLLSLINDILDFNKLESGNVRLEEVNFDLTKLLQNIRLSFSMEAARKNLHLTVHRSQNIPQIICGDPTRLTQILTNLVSNALKFTHQGFVRLYAELAHSKSGELRLRFVVKDTGIGIAQDKQKAIFESFQQAESSTTRKFGGSGLGLSICKRIIEISGGSLQVESEPGLGSTFMFEMAFKEEMDSDHPLTNNADKDEIEAMRAKISGMKVLLVDDNELNIFVAKTILQGLSVDVVTATSGYEALDILEEDQNFDSILLDLQMPGIDGFETSSRIKAKTPLLPVVAMTASSKEEVSFSGRADHFNGFLRKPFEIEQLIETLFYSSLLLKESY